jgi:protein ImuA
MRQPPDHDLPDRDMDRPALLSALRARIARLDRSGGGVAAEAGGGIPLCEAVDAALPGGGLSRAAVHEVLAAEPGAAAGFCALVLARAGGTVLWIAAEPDAWPPGLARFGLSPADLVLVQAPRPVDGLWAMEEALRCPGVAGALLVLRTLDLTAARRLQLAAEAGGAVGLLLRPDEEGEAGGASAALTRWRIGALAGTGATAHDLGDPRWQLDLLRCRGGKPASWRVVWRGAAERLEPDEDNAETEQAARPIRAATARRR